MNCLNYIEFKKCLLSLGFSVGQDEQGKINLQCILAIVAPKDPRYRSHPERDRVKEGHILVQRFLAFMERTDCDYFGLENQEVVQDEEEVIQDEEEVIRSCSSCMRSIYRAARGN